MENIELNIYATGLNKQYWYLTLIRCRNLLLADSILLKKWNEATYDDGTGLKKLIGKVEEANSYINLNIEETTLAYSARYGACILKILIKCLMVGRLIMQINLQLAQK